MGSGQALEVPPRDARVRITFAMAERAIALAEEGHLIEAICRELDVDAKTLFAYRRRNRDFAALFNEARKAGLELLAERTITDARTMADVQRVREVNHATWRYLAKMDPARWGEQVQVHVGAAGSLAKAIAEGVARSDAAVRVRDATRALPSLPTDSGVIELKPTHEGASSDPESVPTFAPEPTDR